MIITDLSVLRTKSRDTSIEECQSTKVFDYLEFELANSKTPGIGLTAIQIGTPLRVCIIRIKHEDHPHKDGKECRLNMINPVIVSKHSPYVVAQEGCLSMPGLFISTDRYDEIVCKWIDYDTKKEMKAYFNGIEAICIQQEIDHMDGIMIVDRKHQAVIKVGRNDICTCGSGKKYKKCCMNGENVS